MADYVWLGAGGITLLMFNVQVAGLVYDATIHALLIGFIMSMIFGHAPIILPAVLKRPIVYAPALYAPFVLLHLSMLLRFVADVTLRGMGRMWGGLLNAAAAFLFVGIMIYMVRSAPREVDFPARIEDSESGAVAWSQTAERSQSRH